MAQQRPWQLRLPEFAEAPPQSVPRQQGQRALEDLMQALQAQYLQPFPFDCAAGRREQVLALRDLEALGAAVAPQGAARGSSAVPRGLMVAALSPAEAAGFLAPELPHDSCSTRVTSFKEVSHLPAPVCATLGGSCLSRRRVEVFDLCGWSRNLCLIPLRRRQAPSRCSVSLVRLKILCEATRTICPFCQGASILRSRPKTQRVKHLALSGWRN